MMPTPQAQRAERQRDRQSRFRVGSLLNELQCSERKQIDSKSTLINRVNRSANWAKGPSTSLTCSRTARFDPDTRTLAVFLTESNPAAGSHQASI
ncbi:uncharacterized [Tachysurus ichikawai]